jgi:hypothetical protein
MSYTEYFRKTAYRWEYYKILHIENQRVMMAKMPSAKWGLHAPAIVEIRA